jgi:hypothetical protein
MKLYGTYFPTSRLLRASLGHYSTCILTYLLLAAFLRLGIWVTFVFDVSSALPIRFLIESSRIKLNKDKLAE